MLRCNYRSVKLIGHPNIRVERGRQIRLASWSPDLAVVCFTHPVVSRNGTYRTKSTCSRKPEIINNVLEVTCVLLCVYHLFRPGAIANLELYKTPTRWIENISMFCSFPKRQWDGFPRIWRSIYKWWWNMPLLWSTRRTISSASYFLSMSAEAPQRNKAAYWPLRSNGSAEVRCRNIGIG